MGVFLESELHVSEITVLQSLKNAAGIVELTLGVCLQKGCVERANMCFIRLGMPYICALLGARGRGFMPMFHKESHRFLSRALISPILLVRCSFSIGHGL